MVVELQVRDDRDLRRECERGAVRLVRLDDEVAAAEAGVRTELRHRRADQPSWVAARLAQRERDQRRRRPLAVRAGDGDRRTRSDRARARNSLRRIPGTSGIRRRDDSLPAVRDVRLGRDLDPHVAERLQVRRADAVPAADLRAPRARELRVRGKARAADPDEPEPAAGHRASASSSSAISSAAPGLAALQHRLAHRLQAAADHRAASERDPGRGRARARARESHRRPARSAARSTPGGRRSRTDTGRGSRRAPRLRSPRPPMPERASTRSHAVTRGAEPVGLGDHAVVGTADAALHELVVAAAGLVQDRRAARAPRVDDELVQSLGAGERTEDAEHRPFGRKLEDLTRFRLRHGLAIAGSAGRRPATFAASASRADTPARSRFANGAASRFARPRCASASVSAAGMRSVDAANTIGPATKPPAPSTTSGRRFRRMRRHARGAEPARISARASSMDGRRGSPVMRNVSSS